MPMEPVEEINIELQDTQWPMTYTDHDREIVRAIVVDDAGSYYFVRAVRDDDFGAATLIETSGGGVEPGESLGDPKGAHGGARRGGGNPCQDRRCERLLQSYPPAQHQPLLSLLRQSLWRQTPDAGRSRLISPLHDEAKL